MLSPKMNCSEINMNTTVRYLPVLVADLTFKRSWKRCLERSLKGTNVLVVDLLPLADRLVVLLWGNVIQVSGCRGNYLPELQTAC